MESDALKLFLALVVVLSAGACRRASNDPAGTPSRMAHSDAEHTAQPKATTSSRLQESAARGSDSDAASTLEVDAGDSAPALPALSAESEFVSLVVPGFRDAIVHVPRGTTSARPVLVALHGNFDRPEWQCEVWQGITRGYPFILCPRGIPRRDVAASMDRWEYGNADAMERELEAGLAALAARFGAHVDPGPVIYTGFSLGGIMGVRVLRRKPSRFPIAVLTEGGYESWTPAFSRAFKEGGGTRILFACGQLDCLNRSKRSVAALTKAGAEAKTVSGGKVGHRYDGPVADAISAEWAWLVAGDSRWQGWQNPASKPDLQSESQK